jgi:hypothetical protein
MVISRQQKRSPKLKGNHNEVFENRKCDRLCQTKFIGDRVFEFGDAGGAIAPLPVALQKFSETPSVAVVQFIVPLQLVFF